MMKFGRCFANVAVCVLLICFAVPAVAVTYTGDGGGNNTNWIFKVVGTVIAIY